MNLLGWQVGPFDWEWVGIVHAPTRGKAKQKMIVEIGDYLDIRAKRLPQFDDKPVTEETLAEMGWYGDGEYDFDPDPDSYIFGCYCEICRGDDKKPS